jgi:hypothetical protein
MDRKVSTATHCYVGTAKCGCDVMVVADYGDKSTAKDVADAISEGYTIRRIPIDEFRASSIPFGCHCDQAETKSEARTA